MTLLLLQVMLVLLLNIAYSAGVFSPALFTVVVVMALATTMMTTPLLNWVGVQCRDTLRYS